MVEVATTELRAALVRAGLASPGEQVVLQSLRGGYRNAVHRWRPADPSGPDLVVKVLVDAPQNPLFPTLPEHEVAAMRLLDGRDVAPRLVAHAQIEQGGHHVVVYEMVPGSTWTNDVAAVGALLARLHLVDVTASSFAFRPLVVEPSSIARAAAAIVELVSNPDLAATLRRAVCAAFERAGRGRRALADAHLVGPCLVHSDVGPGNVVVGPQGARLIDWQCPGLGHPAEDLASFSSPAIQILYGCPALSPSDVTGLLESYREAFGDDRLCVGVDQFDVLAPLYRTRLAAYCAYRREALAESDPEVADRYRRALEAELADLERWLDEPVPR